MASGLSVTALAEVFTGAYDTNGVYLKQTGVKSQEGRGPTAHELRDCEKADRLR